MQSNKPRHAKHGRGLKIHSIFMRIFLFILLYDKSALLCLIFFSKKTPLIFIIFISSTKINFLNDLTIFEQSRKRAFLIHDIEQALIFCHILIVKRSGSPPSYTELISKSICSITTLIAAITDSAVEVISRLSKNLKWPTQ